MSPHFLDDFLTRLAASRDGPAAWSAVSGFLGGLGFDKIVYMFGDWDRPGASAYVARSTVDDIWVAPHFKSLSPDREPLLAYGCKSFAAARMGMAYAGRPDAVPKPHRFFMTRLADSGLRGVVTFPVRLRQGGPFGGWGLSRSMAEARPFEMLVAAHGREAKLAAFLAHERMNDLSGGLPMPPLTAREADCLLWLARGKRLGEIAHLLGVSLPTIEFHLRNAREKLGARTREEAIAKALVGGLIRP